MLAAYEQIDRIRAEKTLDRIEAASVEHMKADDRGSFISRLLARCRGAIAETREVVEELHWNGKVVDISRFRSQWDRFEDESKKPRVRESGRQLVSRLMGRGRR